MADKKSREEELHRLRHPPSVDVPVVGQVNLPDPEGLIWYAGIGAMALIDLIEWPIAALVAGTHFIEHHSRSKDIQDLCDGIDAGA